VLRRDHGGRCRIAAPRRVSRLERADRPVIPAARLAVRFPRSLETTAGLFVVAAGQMNLRERVEDAAGRLPHELERTADVERPVEHLLRAAQVAKAHAD